MAAHASFADVFTKAAQEAYVEYFLFLGIPRPEVKNVPRPEVKNGPNVNDTGDQDDNGHNTILEEFLVKLNIETLGIVDNYLWQKESFHLQLDRKNGHFYGSLQYDINVEDEWFTVHILQQLTLKFPELIARVVDQDGEFLLIEAAEDLPEWAESDEACQNRVYIFQGKIHLIGNVRDEQGKVLARIEEPMDTQAALDLIRKYPDQTVADSRIQRTIQMRIGKYPEKMHNQFHHVNVMLPPKVATLLQTKPSLISSVIRVFHDKDSIDMKAVRTMPTFSPIQDLVKTRVRFTKTLYTMLSSADYFPDMKVNWNMPLPSSKEYKGHSLGAKLTLGFEILLNRGKRRQGLVGTSETSSAWVHYQDKLKENGYYRDLVEGSRQWNELKERAKSYFNSNVKDELEASVEDQASCEALALLQQIHEESFRNVQEEALSDDDESWMEMDGATLESLLADQFKTKISDQKLDQIPQKLKEFMSQMSDFTGVEVPSDGEGEENADGDLDPLDFQADDFVSAMDKLLHELGNPTNDFGLSEPSSEEDEVNVKLRELEKKYCSNNGDPKLEALMGAMDLELQGTEVGKTFQAKGNSSSAPVPRKREKKSRKRRSEGSGVTSSSTYEPVDIDVNVLTNILESFQSQDHPTGPSTNLLRNMGIDISKAAQSK